MNRFIRAAPSWGLGLLLLVFFAAALALAFELPERARPFPIFVISVGIVLIVIEIVLALILPPVAPADTGLDLRADDDYDFLHALRVGAPVFAWTGGLLLLVWLIGPTIAVPVWLAGWLVFIARASLRTLLATVAGFTIITVALFDYLLHVPWPSGEIPGVQQWIQAVLQSWGI